MRAWGVFCALWSLPLALWGVGEEEVTKAQARKAEWQLLAFCVWLHTDGYASSTCINHVGAVKDWHQCATRMPAAYWGLALYRMPTLFRAIKRRNPAKIRDKSRGSSSTRWLWSRAGGSVASGASATVWKGTCAWSRGQSSAWRSSSS